MRALIHQKQMHGHKAVVVGVGVSGQAAVRLLFELGAAVVWVERDEAKVTPQIQALARERAIPLLTGKHSPEQFEGASMVVLSPGVSLDRLIRHLPKSPSPQIISELELASWFVHEPIVAITGTNGKTTTTTLVGELFRAAGREVFVGGNIGTPSSEYVLSRQEADILVLEVSSFQLQHCRSFRPRVGIFLNFSANHLDMHSSIDEYLQAKLSLFGRMTPDDLAILPVSMKDMLERRDFTRAARVWFEPVRRFASPYLRGAHNLANIEAAYLAVRSFGVEDPVVESVLAGFRGLPHRIEIIGEKGGVTFIDDSKGTTIEAMRAAIESCSGPVRLLAGGVFKGGDLPGMIPLLQARVREIGLFGGSREVFERGWTTSGVPMFWEPTLSAATARLYAHAEPGETVLLSPGTSSFDQFRDYKHRGETFKAAFGELQ